MSAWIVTAAHIDVLVNTAVQLRLISTPEANELGSTLWRENHRSVNYRYREETPTPDYRLTPTEDVFHPHAVLKLLACYEYQSCETPDWRATSAYAWCDTLRVGIERVLPAADLRPTRSHGDKAVPAYTTSRTYDQAPWGVDDMSEVPVAASAAQAS